MDVVANVFDEVIIFRLHYNDGKYRCIFCIQYNDQKSYFVSSSYVYIYTYIRIYIYCISITTNICSLCPLSKKHLKKHKNEAYVE